MKKAFIYPTLRCSLSCEMCYMKNHYSNTLDIPFKYACDTLLDLKSSGTERVTFLGGEPTLYPHINELVFYAKKIQLPFIRLQTNGQFSTSFFDSKSEILKYIDALSFSIDGHTEQLNNISRTGCNFDLLVQNIKKSVKSGIYTSVNITVTAYNIDYLMDIINYVSNMGVEIIYVNIVFSGGGAKGHEDLFKNLAMKWDNICECLINYECNHKLRIKFPISVHQKYECRGTYERTKMDCIYIMPNGDKFTCVMMVDRPEYATKSIVYTDKCRFKGEYQNCLLNDSSGLKYEKQKCIYCKQEIKCGGGKR